MFILNIQIIKQNDIIKLIFDNLVYEENFFIPKVNIDEIMQQKFHYSQPDLLNSELKCTVSENRSFNIRINNTRVVVNKFTTSYQLPVRTHYALDFLHALLFFLKHTKYHHIVINNYCIDDYLVSRSRGNHPVETELMLTIDEVLGKSDLVFTVKNLFALVNSVRCFSQHAITFFSSSMTSSHAHVTTSGLVNNVMTAVIEKIKSLNMPKYQTVIQSINQLEIWCKQNKCKLEDVLSIKQRLPILGVDMTSAAMPSQQQTSSRMHELYQLQRKFLGEKKSQDLDHLFDNFIMELKKQLFRDCVSKNNLYRWTSSEWEFLRDAEFRTRSDGRVSIKVQNNRAYLMHYSTGVDPSVFINHLQRLAKILDWTFAECDFHDEIIFTEASSQTLMEKGFHYNLPYVKDLLKMKNLSGLFLQGNKQFQLPRDLLKVIMLDAATPTLNVREVDEMIKIGLKL